MTAIQFFMMPNVSVAPYANFDDAIILAGVKKRLSTYEGPLLRVQRWSDDTEIDIYPDGNGVANEIDISDFCTGTTGSVKIIYDQKGNNNLTQAVRASQPVIYESGSVKKHNGTVCFDLKGTADLFMVFDSLVEPITANGFFFIHIGIRGQVAVHQQILSHTSGNRQFAHRTDNVTLTGSGTALSGIAPHDITKVKGFKLTSTESSCFNAYDYGVPYAIPGTMTSWPLNQMWKRQAMTADLFQGFSHEIMAWNNLTLINESEVITRLLYEY